jgi:hypothetical protein
MRVPNEENQLTTPLYPARNSRILRACSKVLTLLLCISASPSHANWIKYAESDDKELTRYVYERKASSTDRNRAVQIRLEYRTPIVTLDKALTLSSGLIKYELNCKEMRVRVVSVEGYAKPNLKGSKVVDSNDAPAWRIKRLNDWHPINEEDHLAPLQGRLC